MGNGESSVERLKEEFNRRIPMLSINRLPDYALRQFIKLSDEKFEGDRGMALTYLITQNEIANPSALISLIGDLDERIAKLEKPNGTPKVETIRMGNGREIKIGGNKDG